MDKKEGCYCSLGNKFGGHKFHPRWLRIYWELESMGQQTLLPSTERQLPRVSHSKRSTDMYDRTQRALRRRRTMGPAGHIGRDPIRVRAVNHLRLQVYRHVSCKYCTRSHRLGDTRDTRHLR